MAEIILSALQPIVFEKLASAASNKVARPKEIQSQLKKLETSLPPILDLLNDAAGKEIQDEGVEKWLNRLRHVAYDIEDILDSLATDAMHRELTQESVVKKVINFILTCCTSTFSSSTTKMHHKLNGITTELQKLYEEKNNLGLTVKDKRSENINRSRQASVLYPGIIVRQGEKEILLQKLLADHEPCDQNFSIVPIVGMGGIGKTTLARLLYNEPKVKQHFELKAWVCVSDEFDSFNISNQIFESVAGEEKKEKEFKNPNLLQEALRNKLAGKRFLLVLDDVWSDKIEDWETLVPPFHAAGPGSKIIITTRKKQLLQQLGNDDPYHLDKLSHDDALSLFAQHSLGATNFDSYPTLRSYGEGIVQKCDGLPLALKALGSLLRTKTNEEKWKELLESDIWSSKDDRILPALRLSYLDLSPCLKQLFAYSCLFPKDYVFDKEDLILLWMAEGFLLESSTSKSMECLGEEYFDELLSRSFFQHVPYDKSLFMMHDLINDLARLVAGEFFIRLDIDMVKDSREQTLEKYRHMSFVREEFMAFKKFKKFERAHSLRTFLAVPVVVRDGWWKKFYLPNKILVDILPQLPLLRALCLSELQIDEIPESVGDLKHLRYLNLSETPITHLPDNVCNLYNLQTLIVFGCYELIKLPDSFLKLINLRHFDIRDTPFLKNMPFGIGEMKSLQTLSKIGIGGENEFPISGLKNLKNLRRRVCIDGLDKLQNNDQAREVNLSQMRLSELAVEWSDVFDGSRNQRHEKEVLDVLKPHSDNLKELEVVSYGGTEFPKWVTDPSFRRLTVVHMYNCKTCVFLPPLGQLPSLKKLSIESMDEVKEVGSDLLGNDPPAFRSLEILRFDKMPQWEVWSVNAVFPRLKELHIRECPNMARWEVWSANADVTVFPCLEELWIEECPNLVKVSLEALPSLRNLDVWNCGDVLLKSLVCVASSVTKLWIRGISGLSDEVWGGVVQHLGALEELEIRECNEIRNLWESEEAEACKEVFVNLKKLQIEGCAKLVRLGGGAGGKENLGALEELSIKFCREIRYLWESEEAEACKEVFVNLKKLQIGWCDKLVRLGGGAGGKENLGALEELRIIECYEIRYLWESEEAEACKEVFVNLKKLEIKGCYKLEYLSCPNSIETLELYSCRSITRVSFPTGGGSQKLKTLVIEGRNGKVMEELEKQVLNVINNTNIPVLEVLRISDSQFAESHLMKFTCFIQLTRLEIQGCGRVESFPNLQNLTSLKHLIIMNCKSMDGPPPPLRSGGGAGVWPPKLDSLKIGNLKRPISEWGPLPTSSLVELTLWGGFGSSEEEEDVKSFPTSLLIPPSSSSSSLTTLRLYEFDELERISSEGLQHLTSLQHLSILSCPRLKDLPETVLPSLLSLEIRWGTNEELKEKTMSRSGSYRPLLSHIARVSVY